ncbi:MAG TPA: dephospho-CoA kinase [Polyangia bacterium]|nr:dephospho-CoA kinase [Polyangia bacterium]
MAERLKLIGLTGGIGSGKSTVARMIAELGVPVIDADQLARDVVAPGQPANADIALAWPEVMNQDGTIDRKRLARVVFTDPAARARLEAITHPHIAALGAARTDELRRHGHNLAFYEATLLVESGRYKDLDGLVVVSTSKDNQLRRTTARDGATALDVQARIDAQLPSEDKLRVATYVINNDGDLEATRAQVAKLLADLGYRPR